MQEFNSFQYEIFNGTMLGDGCLMLGKNSKNASLSIVRAKKDLDFLKWEEKIFKDFITPSGIKHFQYRDSRTGNTYFSVRFRTKALPIFTEMRKKWYPENVKRVPEDFILTANTLAKWICDDGSISEASTNSLSLKLATHSFDDNSIGILIRELSRIIPDGDFRIYEENNQKTIHCFSITAKRIFRFIDNIFPPGMERKSGIWRNKKYRTFEDKQYTQCKFCLGSNTFKNGTAQNKQKFMCKSCRRQFYKSDKV